jgi:hypothetical protein
METYHSRPEKHLLSFNFNVNFKVMFSYINIINFCLNYLFISFFLFEFYYFDVIEFKLFIKVSDCYFSINNKDFLSEEEILLSTRENLLSTKCIKYQ